MNKRTNFLDVSKLKLFSLKDREHDLYIDSFPELEPKPIINKNLVSAAEKIIAAKKHGAPIVFMMGAHVVRSGVQHYIIDLMKHGFISCIATNGAGLIHDFEFALIGATTESVKKYIKDGYFGFWKETGRINDIINSSENSGIGETLGKAIFEGNFPHKNISLFAQAFKYNIPITVHVSIGSDIIHQHPNFDGSATGAASYRDFLIFARVLENLENGVVMNFGSAVMGPEVYLKGLSMARNIARQKGKKIRNFTVLVCDLHDLPDNHHIEAAKNSAGYFFRPWKTMLVRTASDGGKSFYVKGEHKDTIPALWSAVKEASR